MWGYLQTLFDYRNSVCSRKLSQIKEEQNRYIEYSDCPPPDTIILAVKRELVNHEFANSARNCPARTTVLN